jgi:hypothetical protein
MAKRHGAREQKRLAKQKAKRQTRRRELALRETLDPTVRLKAADRWPVSAALVPDSLWSIGIGSLVIARRTPDGQLACAILLVDVLCLGVKDATWKVLPEGEFRGLRKCIEEHGRLQDVPPEYFAKLVYRAVDYAQSLGFPPHRDFRHAQRLLSGIDPSLCPDEFEFGQDGRPHYIQGPSESTIKARSIAERVLTHGGHVTLLIDRTDPDDFELEEEDDERLYEFDEFEGDDFDDDPFEQGMIDQSEPPIQGEVLPPPRHNWWLPWR